MLIVNAPARRRTLWTLRASERQQGSCFTHVFRSVRKRVRVRGESLSHGRKTLSTVLVSEPLYVFKKHSFGVRLARLFPPSTTSSDKRRSLPDCNSPSKPFGMAALKRFELRGGWSP
jgi:hypothetical protein